MSWFSIILIIYVERTQKIFQVNKDLLCKYSSFTQVKKENKKWPTLTMKQHRQTLPKNLPTVQKKQRQELLYTLHTKLDGEKLWYMPSLWKSQISYSKHTCICNRICVEFNHERIICCDMTTTEILTINKAHSGTHRCRIFSPMHWWD